MTKVAQALEDGGRKAVLTLEDMEAYLRQQQARGCAKETLSSYRRSLRAFYQWLPEDKQMHRRTAWEYQETLRERFMPRTVNLKMIPINGLLDSMNLRDFQVTASLPFGDDDSQPELTREEYLRLLSAAKAQGNQRLYLLIKLFATTGIAVQEVPQVTAEAVREGSIVTTPNHSQRVISIPSCVKEELLEYAAENHIEQGPLFLTRNGKVLGRTAISTMIQRFAKSAKVDENKCNPRCLQKLYNRTVGEIQAKVAVLMRMTYDTMLEKEQQLYGWRETSPMAP